MVGIHSRSTDVINPVCRPFINACGNNIKNFEIVAISKLADMLIQFNIWEKFIAIYPFVGATRSTHSLNLKNINEYTITWAGDLAFNRSGVTGMGGYGVTNILLRSLSQVNNTHISVYNRTPFNQITGEGRLIGTNTRELIDLVSQAGALELNFNKVSGIVGYVYNKINTLGGHGFTINEMINNNINGTGLMIGMNSYECYLNNQVFGYRFPALPTEIHPQCPRQLTLFSNRYEYAATSAINANIAFASVGSGFSKKEVESFNFAVESFQRLMLRSVM